MSKHIIINEAGTTIRVGKTDAVVILTDDNCIWDISDDIHFTPNGWKKYQERKKNLPHQIDNMRKGVI